MIFGAAHRQVMTERHLQASATGISVGRLDTGGNKRVRTELMVLTGYFHTESSHHASEYWSGSAKPSCQAKPAKALGLLRDLLAHSPDHNVDELVETSPPRRPDPITRVRRLHHRLHDDGSAPGYLRERP